jgi:ribosomal protein S28E/S33
MDPRQLPRCRLSRRQFVCALVAVAMPMGVARAQQGGMVEYVRDLYVREIEMHLSRKPSSAEAFSALFARDLRALMQAPRPGLAHEPIGRILHAFFGWGVLPGQPVKLVQVIPALGGTGGLTLVRVDLEHHGATHQIIVRPVREDGLWKIADVSYDNGEDLRTYYRRITGR